MAIPILSVCSSRTYLQPPPTTTTAAAATAAPHKNRLDVTHLPLARLRLVYRRYFISDHDTRLISPHLVSAFDRRNLPSFLPSFVVRPTTTYYYYYLVSPHLTFRLRLSPSPHLSPRTTQRKCAVFRTTHRGHRTSKTTISPRYDASTQPSKPPTAAAGAHRRRRRPSHPVQNGQLVGDARRLRPAAPGARLQHHRVLRPPLNKRVVAA